jgi:hypothetical protein
LATPGKTLAEQIAEQLLPVVDRILRQLDRPANKLGIEDVGVQPLCADHHVFRAIVDQGHAFAGRQVADDGYCRVVDRRDVDLLAAGGEDLGADAGVIHRAPGHHRLDDEVRQGHGDGVAALRCGTGRLDAELGVAVVPGLQHGAFLGRQLTGRDSRDDFAEHLAVFDFVAVLCAAAFAVAGLRAHLGPLLFLASLGRSHALFTSDSGVEGIELCHDCIVAGVEFLRARLVGVLLDLLERFAGLSNQSAPLLLKFGLAHCNLLS